MRDFKLKIFYRLFFFLIFASVATYSVYADDTSPPELYFPGNSPATKITGSTYIIKFTVEDDTDVTSVDYQIDSGDWVTDACTPDDGTFGDGMVESVTCTVTDLTQDTSPALHFRATDSTGNTTDSDNYLNFTINVVASSDRLVSDIKLEDIFDIYEATGFLSEPRFYNSSNLANEASPRSGAITFSSDESVYFDDINKILSFSGGSQKFKVEAYVKSASFNTGDTKVVVSKLSNEETDMTWYLGIDPNGGVKCLINTDAQYYIESSAASTPATLTDGAWNKIACSFDSTDGKLTAYINGVEVASDTIADSSRNIQESYGPLAINGKSDIATSFNDSIEAVKVYNYLPEITPPTITNITDEWPSTTALTTFNAHVKGHYLDGILSSVEYKLEDGSWNACTADDSSFDVIDADENATCTIADLTVGQINHIKFRSIGNGDITTPESDYLSLDLNVVTNPSHLVTHLPLNDVDSIADTTGFLPIGQYVVHDGLRNHLSDLDGAIDFDPGSQIFYKDPDGLLAFAGAGKSFKVQAYVYANDFTDPSLAQAPVVGKNLTNDPSTENFSWVLGIDSVGGVYCVVNATGASGTIESGNTGPSGQLNNAAWNKIACSYNSNTGVMNAYLNDTLVDTYTITGGSLELPEASGILQFPGYHSGNTFVGFIDDISIYDTDIPPSPPSFSVTNKYLYRTTSGNFEFTGTATGYGSVTNVQWRAIVLGQGDEDGWSSCTADDGTFDSVSESYTCEIPTTSTNGEYNFELRTHDAISSEIDHIFVVGTLDTNKDIDTWFNFSNITDFGQQNGDSRSFGSITVSGTPTFTSGKYGDGASIFNGSSSFSMEDSTPYLDYSGSDRTFSIEARVKPYAAGDGTNRDIFTKNWDSTDDHSYWNLIITSTGAVSTSLRVGTNSVGHTTAEHIVNLDEWNDIVARYDVANRIVCVSVNGATATCSAWLFAEPVLPAVTNITVGEHFNGEIDDIVLRRTADATPPIVTISPLTNSDRVTTNSPSFNFTFSDTNGGVASAEYYVSTSTSGPQFNTWVPITTPTDGSWGGTSESATVVLSGLNDGATSVEVRSVDTSGNTNVNFGPVTSAFFSPSYSFNIEAVDSTAPRIYANPVLPNPSIDRQPAIRGFVKDYLINNAGDSISNIAGISYSLDGGDFAPINALDGNYNSSKEDFYFQIPHELSFGAHTIRIRATDSSGNSTEGGTVNEPLGDISLDFNIVAPDGNTDSQNIVRTISFNDHDLQDTIFSDAVWGNGIIRLRQKINFTPSIEIAPTDRNTWGYDFGFAYIAVYPSTDGNIWISGTDGSILYYNKDTNTYTKYPTESLKGNGSQIGGIYEFEDNGNRYLAISYYNNGTTIIYDINNTPENIADDPAYVDYRDKAGFPTNYDMFGVYATDTRTSTLALFAAMDGNVNGHSSLMRLDLNGTPMDISDDTYTVWGEPEGLANNSVGDYAGSFTATMFDQAEHKFIGFNYSYGMYTLDDNNTPTDKSDDIVTTPWTGNINTESVFSVIKDSNGWYWFGGDGGVQRIDLHSNNDPSDDTVVDVLSGPELSGDQISKLQWVPGVYPVGDEIWAMTRQGRVRGIEYNFTYDDDMDDTSYVYKIPQYDYRSGGASSFLMPDRNTIWVAVPGEGLQKIALDRSYEDSNVIEIYPIPPANLLEVDHVLLSDVVGTVSAGSSFTLSDLVTYEISNDAGVTWRPTFIGDTINFLDSDYKLKIRITLHKGSTPIMSSLKLSYVAQPKGTIAAGDSSEDDESDNNSCSATKPSGKPVIYKVTPIDDDKLQIYFNPENKPVDKYQIKYGTQSGTYTRSEETSDYGKGYYTIKGLEANTSYHITIRAIHDCAKGDWSNEVIGTTHKTDYVTPNPKDWLNPAPIVKPIEEAVKNIGEAISEKNKEAQSRPETPSSKTAKLISNIMLGGLAAIMALGLVADALGLLSIIKEGSLKTVSLIATGFFRKKRLPWGVVYDSKTKRPLDPVILTLTSETGKVFTAISDMYGRYNFIVDPGKYTIKAEKTDYAFPSTSVKNQLDELVYSDVLSTTELEIKANETVNLNIPMDALKANWNEEEKNRMNDYKAPSRAASILRKIGFAVGIIWSGYATYQTPTITNLIIVSVFTLYLIYLSYKDRYNSCGHLYDPQGKPVNGFVVELIRAKFPNMGRRTAVTDIRGRFGFLVDKGDYKLAVYKLVNGTKVQLYESETITYTKNIGAITKDIHLK